MAHYTLIIEDHPLYREGLGDTLASILTDTVVLKASSAEEGLMLTDHLQEVRLICLDLGLPNLQGIDAVSVVRAKFPKAVLIVVSGTEEAGLQKLAVERGADAFIPKSAPGHEIAAVVHRAMAGEWLVPRFDPGGAKSVAYGSQQQADRQAPRSCRGDREVARVRDISRLRRQLPLQGSLDRSQGRLVVFCIASSVAGTRPDHAHSIPNLQNQ